MKERWVASLNAYSITVLKAHYYVEYYEREMD